jgi:hypothetical protein
MITFDDYTYTENSKHDEWIIRLLTGPYKDTFYVYDKVQLRESADGSEATLGFVYKIISSEIPEEQLNVDPLFKNYIGDVLTHVIEDAMNRGHYGASEDE